MEPMVESTSLIAEAQRYLSVVDEFRAEGCELHWCSDSPVPSPQESGLVRAGLGAVANLRTQFD